MRSFICAVLLLAGLAGAQGAEKPEQLLAAAKKVVSDQPWQVDCLRREDPQFRVTGLICKNDFDLTTTTAETATRQIVVGDHAWTSTDGGKNWQAGDPKDRQYYYLVHTPIRFVPGEKIPPFELPPRPKGSDPAYTWIRFLSPQPVGFEGDRPNYWIKLKAGKPVRITHYSGQGVYQGGYTTVFVDYSEVPVTEQIVPPPGNARASALEPGAERLLKEAFKRMSTQTYQFKCAASGPKTLEIDGLIKGEEFSLTLEVGDEGGVPMRQIALGEKTWNSTDNKTWHAGESTDRLPFNMVHLPIKAGTLLPAFEEVSRETHGAETWVNLQIRAEQNSSPENVNKYTVVLDSAGQALYVRRAESPVLIRGGVVFSRIDFTPTGEKITPPETSH